MEKYSVLFRGNNDGLTGEWLDIVEIEAESTESAAEKALELKPQYKNDFVYVMRTMNWDEFSNNNK